MDCIAHQGFAGVNPENTLPAVRAAAAVADAVEVDVRRCGSGELVASHDETVDRTTDETGQLSEFTTAELAACSVQGSDAGIPTLADVLGAVPDGVTVHAELKERGLAGDLGSLTAGARARVVVSSFDVEVVRDVAGLPTAFLTEEIGGAIETARSVGCQAVHPSVDVVDDEFVARAHESGLAVNAWTVTDAAEVRRLREAGVDGMFADYPACCRERS